MSLAADIRAIVADAMTAFDDLQVTVTLTHQTGAGTYDPATGETAGGTATYTPRAVLGSYRTFEIDGQNIRPNDKKVLIAANDLAVTPGVDDAVTISGETWVVVDVKTDPASAMWVLRVRR
jgi:hypothetical protein